MNNSVPEFSRLVPLARLGSEPFRTAIEATPGERERLAERFDLIALDRLAAVVTLQRVNGELIRLDATFEAEFVQSCVVTLDPVPGRVAQTFSLVYAPLEEQQTEIDLDIDEPVFEPLTGDTIDIGEAVAQELSLALPDFPRLEDAVIDPLEAAEAEDSPFAALERLRHSLN
ncbi:MAG: DUF177 domain-containing protein [Alphaproteobacteria bacterium]|nr:DUF177 domain-containing protein [Alphaproteobacteria bacterium]